MYKRQNLVFALIIGGGIGGGVGWYLALNARGDNKRKVIMDLESQLDQAKQDRADYEAEVSEHFSQTASLLHKLTDDYRAVYTHLADGAEQLCGDRVSISEAARDRGADAIVVHHGYFWHSEPPCITGMKAARVRALIQADINLFAYHLPLDCHPLHGNNAALGRLMGIEAPEALHPEDPGTPVFRGQLPESLTVQGLADRLSAALDRSPLVIGDGDVTSVAWCTGAGQGYIDLAADAGADVYVTGEVSEQTAHVALERGIAFIGAGHHATERYGVQAVGSLAAEALGLSHEFIDIDNPA